MRLSFPSKRGFAALLLAAASVLGLCACGASPKSEQTEILTQKVAAKDKIPVTVLVKYAFSINAFEKAVEEKFPELDLIQVGNYTYDRGLVEYERRLKHDDLTDIVMTWPLNVGEQYWSDRLIDLSSMPFTSKYNTAMLNSIASEGKLYYLPGPAQVRGIVYNKTLFEENGWEVPKDYNGFIALCQQIEASGIRSLQLGFANPEVLDTALIGFSYGKCHGTPQDAQWLVDYNAGNGSFGDHFGKAIDIFQDMMDAGVWKKSDLEVDYAKREQMFFSRECAMIEDSVLMARLGQQMVGSSDQFALMPFFNPDNGGDWARLYMVCYIGLNKHLEEPQNKKKYDLVLKLMDYISTPEGQEALAADTGAMYSSAVGVPPPDVPEIQALLPSLSAGRYAVFPELKNATNAMRKGFAGLLSGALNKEDVIAMIDKENTSPKSEQKATPIGLASSDFSLIETGNFITDIMRQKSGAEVALFLDNGKDGRYNGKGLSGRFYEGEQWTEDVIRVLPDMKRGEKGVLETVTMTGENLLRTLEYAIEVDKGIDGWFYYFSGLRMEYAPSAEPGSRIRKITDADGKDIDPQKVYTVAVMDGSYPAELVQSCDSSELKISTLLIEAIQNAKSISPSKDGRFQIAAP